MELIGDPFKPLEPYIIAAAFALARMLAMMAVFPVFDRLGVTGFVRNSIAVVISIPLIPMIAAHLEGEQLSLGLIVALILKEVIVGLIVGLVLAVPLYAAEAAGDILDLQRGSSSATLSDPLGSSQSAITGTLLALVVIALYFASGCFDLTLRAIYDSYGIWPVRRFLPLFSREAGGCFSVCSIPLSRPASCWSVRSWFACCWSTFCSRSSRGPHRRCSPSISR